MSAEPRHQSKFQWLTRLGFVSRGLLYIVIALLVIAAGRTEDVTGAMEYLGRGVGRLLLVVLTAGLLCYGLWRFADAWFGMESGRHHPKAWRSRIAAAGSGVIYLFLAYKALAIILSGRAGTGSAHDNAVTALRFPGGAFMLAVIGAALIGAGVVQMYKASTCSFLQHLDDRARQYWAKWLGRSGYAARGIVFVTVGFLLGRAGFRGSAAGAGGLEQALDAFSDPLEYAVAAGLMLFGVYSILEARFRTVHQPPFRHIQRELNAAIDS